MIQKRSAAAWVITTGMIIIALCGCGYRFVGGPSSGAAETPAIVGPVIENHTRHPGLDLILAEAIAQRFIIERRPFVKHTAEADTILRCTIRSLDIHPISFRRNLTAREYRVTMTLDAALEQQGKALTVWKSEGLTLIRTYRVQNTIQATEREKKAALETLSFDAAAIIADGILRGF